MLLTNLDSTTQEAEIMRNLAITLRLEKNMTIEVKTLLRRVNSDFQVYYSQFGSVQDITEYRSDFTGLLKKWYKKTANIFSKNIRGGLKYNNCDFWEHKGEVEASVEQQDDINAEISAGLLLLMNDKARTQADYILATTSKDVNLAISKAQLELFQEGGDLSNKEVSKRAKRHLDELAKSRSELIAQQEIGMMSSASEEEEALVLDRQDPSVVVGGVVVTALKKNWNALLDSRTRDFHRVAHSRYANNPIELYQKFIVGGEALDYPRDSSGSPANIMRCRCQRLFVARRV